MNEKKNLSILLAEIAWLQQLLEEVIRSYLQQEGFDKSFQDFPPPEIEEEDSPYAQLIKQEMLGANERLLIALAMAPHFKPEALDLFFGKNQNLDRGFTEFGGVSNEKHGGFLPTVQSFHFLLSAKNQELGIDAKNSLSPESFLIKEGVISLGETEAYLSQRNALLSIGSEWLTYFIEGHKPTIPSGSFFPAEKITTSMEWEDAVLTDAVEEQLDEIASWLKNKELLMNEWGLEKILKPGYRALFYGPPGTGKTLTATLLGKSHEKEVYKVDLSMIVSKYIGETEKNLSQLFDRASNKDWILFFDEADALFGKRTAANSSNDRFANQQTAYLLQRIENYPGVVILASNLKANMDEAFSRRFQAMVHFPMPGVEERLLLWQNAFGLGCSLEEGVELYQIAEDYELAGGSIINVLRYCALKAVKTENKKVNQKMIYQGIRREYRKENKTLQIPV